MKSFVRTSASPRPIFSSLSVYPRAVSKKLIPESYARRRRRAPSSRESRCTGRAPKPTCVTESPVRPNVIIFIAAFLIPADPCHIEKASFVGNSPDHKRLTIHANRVGPYVQTETNVPAVMSTV